MLPGGYILILAVVSFLLRMSFAGFTTTKIGPKPLWNLTMIDKLRQDLLLNYDKFARPDHENSTEVEFNIEIHHVELNELKHTLLVHAWAQMEWNDPKLKWDAEKYGNIKSLHFAEHEIWQPDLFLYNSATGAAINHYGNTHCLTSNLGKVLWVPPAQFQTLCEINLKYWPFDEQECSLIFGSWTYDGNEVQLHPMHNATEPQIDLLISGTEWKITKTSLKKSTKVYQCCPEPYIDVEIKIHLQRVSPSYKAIVVTPTFVIVFLTLASFWLPPQSGEKVILNCCSALIITLLLIYFTQKLPAMGNHTPILVLFYSCSLYIVTLSTIGSIVVILISRTKHSNHLPWYIKYVLTGTVGKILLLDMYIEQKSPMMQNRTSEELRDTHVQDFEIHSGDEHLISQIGRAHV